MRGRSAPPVDGMRCALPGVEAVAGVETASAVRRAPRPCSRDHWRGRRVGLHALFRIQVPRQLADDLDMALQSMPPLPSASQPVKPVSVARTAATTRPLGTLAAPVLRRPHAPRQLELDLRRGI